MNNEWISVKDGTPVYGENVIVRGYQEEGDTELLTFYNTAPYDVDGWSDEVGTYENGEQVLFWMPLPYPPKSDDTVG